MKLDLKCLISIPINVHTITIHIVRMNIRVTCIHDDLTVGEVIDFESSGHLSKRLEELRKKYHTLKITSI